MLGPLSALLLKAHRLPSRLRQDFQKLRTLAAEFRDGGVVVENIDVAGKDDLCIVLQLDGDLQICLKEGFRDADEATRQRRLKAYLETLEARLAPLRRLKGAIRCSRVILVSLAAGAEGIQIANGTTLDLAFAWLHVVAALMAVGGLLTRRILHAVLLRCLDR